MIILLLILRCFFQALSITHKALESRKQKVLRRSTRIGIVPFPFQILTSPPSLPLSCPCESPDQKRKKFITLNLKFERPFLHNLNKNDFSYFKNLNLKNNNFSYLKHILSGSVYGYLAQKSSEFNHGWLQSGTSAFLATLSF